MTKLPLRDYPHTDHPKNDTLALWVISRKRREVVINYFSSLFYFAVIYTWIIPAS